MRESATLRGERWAQVTDVTLGHVRQGCDVLLRGERGSGKSTALGEVQRALSAGGAVGVTLTASGIGRLAAVARHPSAAGQIVDRESGVQWLSRELNAKNCVLLIDDIDRVDSASLDVIRDTLRMTPCRLVATTSSDPLRNRRTQLAEVLAERVPLQLRMAPLGFAPVSSVLTKLLGGPADARLTSEVLAQSGGNPRAVTTLARAARASGSIHESSGVWSGDLADTPVDALTLAFLPMLDRDQMAAIELLACTGPVPADSMQDLIGPAVLDALVETGRVVCHDFAGTGPVLAVAPPALARGVREQVGPYRSRQIARRVHAHFGTTEGLPLQVVPTPRAAGDSGNGDLGPYWSTQVAGLTHERAEAMVISRRRDWSVGRSVPAANTYLRALLRKPRADLVEQVFARTRLDSCDDAGELARFAHFEARWAEWTGAAPEEVRARVAARVDHDLAVSTDVMSIRDDIVRKVREGAEPVRTPGAVADRSSSGLVGALVAEASAVALLEAGLPAQALDRAAAGELAGGDPEFDHHLGALRSESLLMLGRLDEAEQRTRSALRDAYEQADVLGVRIHSCVLAEVLFFAGRSREAWDALSASHRLGAGGPLEVPFSRRALAVAAILQAHGGNHTVARIALRELGRSPQSTGGLVQSLEVFAHVAIASTVPDRDDSIELAWDAGVRFAQSGRVLSAVLAWIGLPCVLGRERAGVLREVCAGVSIPLLDPYVRLHLALADRDAVAGREALTGVSPGVTPFLVDAAKAQFGLGPGRLEQAVAPGLLGQIGKLTARELEIASLACEHLSNTAIATMLAISVRTVENHMAHVLRKTGCRSRRDLPAALGLGDPIR